jgi:hypothetical protein
LVKEYDSKRFIEVLEMVQIGIGKGRPRSRPLEVDADSAYDNKNLRSYLKQRGIKANIPCNDRNRKTPKRGRPIRFNGESYKNRGSIERFFGWIKMGIFGGKLIISFEFPL